MRGWEPLAERVTRNPQVVAFTLQDVVDTLDEAQGYPGFTPPPKGVEANTAHALQAKLRGLGSSGVLDWNATNQNLPTCLSTTFSHRVASQCSTCQRPMTVAEISAFLTCFSRYFQGW